MKTLLAILLFSISVHAQDIKNKDKKTILSHYPEYTIESNTDNLLVLKSSSGTKAFIFTNGQCKKWGVEMPADEIPTFKRWLLYRGYAYVGEMGTPLIKSKGKMYRSFAKGMSAVIMDTDLKGREGKIGVWVIAD